MWRKQTPPSPNAISFTKMAIARKEAKETRFWLRIILKTPLLDIPEVHALLQESDELIRILSTIINAKKKP